MTIEETRQLGIEFERRIQTIAPLTEFVAKLDTETIYSFLNLYQDKFIHELYKSLEQIQNNSNISARVERILLDLLTQVHKPLRNGRIYVNEDFGLYVRSSSDVTKTYRYKRDNVESTPASIPNKLVSLLTLNEYLQTPSNDMRILPNPIVAFSPDKTYMDIIYDKYTTVTGVDMLYYKIPTHFSILDNTACKLSIDVFDELVSGAVDLYIHYASGTNKNKLQEAAKSKAENNNNE